VDVLNPYYDYISPDLVSLFITNVGGHPPSYIYRLVIEGYNAEDISLKLDNTSTTSIFQQVESGNQSSEDREHDEYEDQSSDDSAASPQSPDEADDI
jgi:hypothetical protein